MARIMIRDLRDEKMLSRKDVERVHGGIKVLASENVAGCSGGIWSASSGISLHDIPRDGLGLTIMGDFGN